MFVVENRNHAMEIGRIGTDKLDVERREMIGADHDDVFAWRRGVIDWYAAGTLAQDGQGTSGDKATRQDEDIDEGGRTRNSVKPREGEKNDGGQESGDS